MNTTNTTVVRIWDLPTRIFHWALAACVIALLVTGHIGGNAMVWHFRLGYGVFSLLLFRLIWGLVGGHWSRWSQLPLSPASVRAYLHGDTSAAPLAGHNPLGSWSVLALLGMLALQVGTGLISDDEISNAGPLSTWVVSHWVTLATSWHKGPGKAILIALVLTHWLALTWYRWHKGQVLVPAMWHGDKTLQQAVTPSRDGWINRIGALFVLLACAGLVFYIVRLSS